jgi:hypothetical protein
VNVVDFSVERYEPAILKNKTRHPGCCLVTKAVAITHRGGHSYRHHSLPRHPSPKPYTVIEEVRSWMSSTVAVHGSMCTRSESW